MVLNVALCLALFGVAAYMGNMFASRVERRPAALELLRAGLDGLRTRLEYRGEPLSPAFANMADELGGDMASVFAKAAKLMDDMPAGDALYAALDENKREGGKFWPLQETDLAIAQGLAGRIGGDSGSQQAAFAIADSALRQAAEQALEEKAGKGRLYRTAGLLTGALLAVLFI